MDLLSFLCLLIYNFSGSHPMCQACWSVCACVCVVCVISLPIYLYPNLSITPIFSYYYNYLFNSLDLITFFCYLLSIFFLNSSIIIITIIIFGLGIILFSLTLGVLCCFIFFPFHGLQPPLGPYSIRLIPLFLYKQDGNKRTLNNTLLNLIDQIFLPLEFT